MGDVFKGVYCIDEVNAKPIEISAAYVFNSEARRRPQGHWFAIYTNIQGVTFYFNIFKTPPDLPEIIQFVIVAPPVVYILQHHSLQITLKCLDIIVFAFYYKSHSWI